MASNIDPTQPPSSNPTTSAMRANMASAKSEIEFLQKGTVGSGGQFATLLEASAYLKSLVLSDWVTEIAASTFTIAAGSKLLTLSGGNLWTNDIVRNGDQWSPDGQNFYTVAQVIGNTRCALETPWMGSTVSALSPCAFYRPKFQGLTLLQGEHDRLDLDGETLPNFVELRAKAGALIVGSANAESTRGLITVPRQGIINAIGLFGRAVKYNPCFLGSTDGVNNPHGTSIVRSIGCDLRSMNVDYFQPAGNLGRFEMLDSIGSFAQDGCLPDANDTTIIRNSRLIGDNSYSGFSYWHLRMFAGQLGHGVDIENSLLELNHRHSVDPAVPSEFFDPNYPVTYRASNCRFKISSAGAASKAFLIANPSGLAGQAATILSNCSADAVFASGTPTLVEAKTWTGTATVSARGCDFSGFAIGGGGTLTPDIGVDKFNVL